MHYKCASSMLVLTYFVHVLWVLFFWTLCMGMEALYWGLNDWMHCWCIFLRNAVWSIPISLRLWTVCFAKCKFAHLTGTYIIDCYGINVFSLDKPCTITHLARGHSESEHVTWYVWSLGEMAVRHIHPFHSGRSWTSIMHPRGSV